MALTTVQAGLIGNSQAGSQSAINSGMPIYENSGTVSINYCITTGSNAMSSGPITIADGITVDIPDGSEWTIV